MSGEAVVRWVLQDVDAGEQVTLPLNPNKMDTLNLTQEFDWAAGSFLLQEDRPRGTRHPTQPQDFNFSGVLLSKTHHDLLLAWCERDIVLRVTDHLNRTFEMVILKFDPVERLPTRNTPWRADYTINGLLLGELK